MLLSFVKDGLQNLAILRKLCPFNLACSRSTENSIIFGSISHVLSPCSSEAWSAFYLVFTWPCESLSFLSIDTNINIMFVGCMVSPLKHGSLLLHNYLIDFWNCRYILPHGRHLCRHVWFPPSIFVLQLIPFISKDFFSKTYHFSPGMGGLAYLGLGTGFIVAMIFGARFADRIYKDVKIFTFAWRDFSGSLFL